MKNYFFPITSAEAKQEAERVEAIQRERRAIHRLANEMTLIRAAGAQNDREIKAQEARDQLERQAWAETLTAIRLIQIEFDR